MSNYSSDLFWEITRNNSSHIVKRGTGTSKVIFSKEPMNLTNKHTRTQSGLVNEKAIGVQPASDRGVILIIKTRNETNGRKPKALFKQTCLKHTNRQVYGAVVNSAAKQHYRPDLLQDAVVRASAILRSQRAKSGAKKTGA